jgi:hypothetical protein
MARIVKIARGAQVQTWDREACAIPSSISRPALKPNDSGPIKPSQGAGFDEVVDSVRQTLTKARSANPDTSRVRRFRALPAGERF